MVGTFAELLTGAPRAMSNHTSVISRLACRFRCRRPRFDHLFELIGRTSQLWGLHTRIYDISKEGNMAFEQADFGNSVTFDFTLLGTVGSAEHLRAGPAPMAGGGRPQLSLVPERVEYLGDDSAISEEDQWQERALCAQTDPEAFFPEKGGSTREAKRICLGCEVRDECLDYALAHDERFGIWGGLSERERRRIKRGII